MPQAIFFDLDETLIRHSMPVMEQLRIVTRLHLADLSEARWNVFQEHLRSSVGRLWNNIAAHRGRCEAEFTAIFGSALECAGCDAALAAPMVEAFISSVVESTGPTEGALEVLDRLADAGIPTGIITNGFSFLQKRKARAHGLAGRVRVVMTSEDAGAHKPDARIFRMAAEQIGVDAEDCWHVGDHLDNDIAGATGAGLRGVLYTADRPPADAAQGPVPYRLISRLMQLPELIADDGPK